MDIHTDWTTRAFGLTPAAPLTGPFTTGAFQRAWWEHFGADGDEVLLAEGPDGLVPLWRRLGRLEMPVDEDLADYHSPLGPGAAAVMADAAGRLGSGTPFRFDSLPQEAAEILSKGLAEAGTTAPLEEHSAALFIELPSSFDEYLAGLDKKQRHELRRKRRRYEDLVGRPQLERSGSGAAFGRLHRRSDGTKGDFMTETMESFFADLLMLPGARLDSLVAPGGAMVAMAFGFEDDDAYYLYNAAYDPDCADASPGMVLLSELIAEAIAGGRQVFDLLKGEEKYKYRLGARRRPLYVLEGRL